MLNRTTSLVALAAAALITAGGSTASVVLTAGSEHDLPAAASHGQETSAAHAHQASAPQASGSPSEIVLPSCSADVKNHGAYVSSVARADRTEGVRHGDLVSAAAQSDCGKPEGSEGPDESESPSVHGSANANGERGKSEGKGGERGKSGESHGAPSSHPTGPPSS